MAINDLTIPQPDFQTGNIIDPEEFDANNAAIVNKVNEVIGEVNDNLVGKTGDETIAGVKTFNSSPIVPTPSADSEVANKSYIDGVAADFMLGAIPDNTLTTAKDTPEKRTLTINKSYKASSGVNFLVITTDGNFDFTQDGQILTITPINNNTGAGGVILDGTSKNAKKWDADADAYVDLEADDYQKNVDVRLTWSVSNNFFILAPSGGVDEWGGLTFVVEEIIGRLYSSDTSLDDIAEINPFTGIVLNQVSAPSSNPWGVGGISNRLYTLSAGTIFEIDKDTLLSLSNANPGDASLQDVGGMLSRLFSVGNVADVFFELDVDTKLPTNTVTTPSTTPVGSGGINNRLYHCDLVSNLVYEMNPDTLLSLSNTPISGSDGRAIGGTNDRLYNADSADSKIYELDLDTKLSVGSFDSYDTLATGVGGLKQDGAAISITKVSFEGTEYELTDDSDFRVSGVA